ncbi:MAG TPA: substrate-binding domain-containing protein [Candidatus Pullichristensenella excrementigallinarum]|uniref:Substrate-binding domain-containing protein n=1 Tax=Candidatus Pullichristensenella excrementigallinarum TaxID=2840907 RepID=A0A9D1IBC5_9FIRM|nr:substrate-binding domain-containing protein [Candidatus Pullichristensenella excrementigallinarum]
MKKIFAMLLTVCLLASCAFAEAMEGPITVISREEGSGTRGAFVELTGVEQKDEEGNKVDMTTEEAVVTNSTSVMMTSVAGDENAIGYVSLGSLNDTVKAVDVDGYPATVESIKAGEYAVARPFVIATCGEIGELAQDFLNYILSADGQAVIEENGYISVNDAAEAYTASGLSGKLTVGGSSSVTPVMEKLAEAYMALNADVEIAVQQSDSTTGVNSAIEGIVELGMASRELKDSEIEQGVTGTTIAMDGIAVIVNNANPTSALTSEQIAKIFTGEITDWSEIAE